MQQRPIRKRKNQKHLHNVNKQPRDIDQNTIFSFNVTRRNLFFTVFCEKDNYVYQLSMTETL